MLALDDADGASAPWPQAGSSIRLDRCPRGRTCMKEFWSKEAVPNLMVREGCFLSAVHVHTHASSEKLPDVILPKYVEIPQVWMVGRAAGSDEYKFIPFADGHLQCRSHATSRKGNKSFPFG